MFPAVKLPRANERHKNEVFDKKNRWFEPKQASLLFFNLLLKMNIVEFNCFIAIARRVVQP